jgi:hypothetical protein
VGIFVCSIFRDIFIPDATGYQVKDTVFDFWYSFVFPNREAIETDTFRPSAPVMDRYFGKRFEGFVRSREAGSAGGGGRVRMSTSSLSTIRRGDRLRLKRG